MRKEKKKGGKEKIHWNHRKVRSEPLQTLSLKAVFRYGAMMHAPLTC